MGYQLLKFQFVMALFVLLGGCGSDMDPCDMVSCDFGSCLEGTCRCDFGYEGRVCSLGRIEGVFQMSLQEFDPCNGDGPLRLSQLTGEEITCVSGKFGSECTNHNIKFKSNGTFVWTRLSGSRLSGSREASNNMDKGTANRMEGGYSKTEEAVTLCPSNNTPCLMLTRDGDALLLSRESSEGCLVKEIYTKMR